jgi:hypothetical protein
VPRPHDRGAVVGPALPAVHVKRGSGTADRKTVASQLRLRVILPVAVLGVLGLGVGAFATTRSAPGDDQPPPPPPAQGTTTTGPEEGSWANRANALCLRLMSDLDSAVPEEVETPQQVEAALAKLVTVYASAQGDFAKLGWPAGEKRTVLELRTLLTRYVAALRDSLAAVRAGNPDAIRRELGRADGYAASWNRKVKRLGADVCAEDPFGALADRAIEKYGSAERVLEHELQQHGVVVVLLYAPGDDYDTIQTRETRAGALAANAGFLALDVTKNKHVGPLAARYDLRDAPMTVVFKTGPKVVYRVAGYMDRAAIAQAAAGART